MEGDRRSELELEGKLSPVPLVPGLVTLSTLPRTQWQNLAHIEAIKERNKPIKPAEKPAAAPFFLPTVAGVHRDVIFDLDGGIEDQEMAEGDTPGTAPKTHVLRGMEGRGTPFLAKLRVKSLPEPQLDYDY